MKHHREAIRDGEYQPVFKSFSKINFETKPHLYVIMRIFLI